MAVKVNLTVLAVIGLVVASPEGVGRVLGLVWRAARLAAYAVY